MNALKEDDLQHLHLFTKYGRLALKDTGTKPFQRLQCLVRDWSFPYEAEYGAAGDGQHPEQQSLRRHISACFEKVACFLMPHPGLYVATDPNFGGRLTDIATDFKENLCSLLLLSPQNRVFKEIGGQRIRAGELIQYLQSYLNIYKGNELPEPKSMLLATAEANHLSAMASTKDMYKSLMNDICGGTRPYLNTADLEAEHLNVKEENKLQFLAIRKMGGEAFTQGFYQQLDTDLEELFTSFKEQNESKNIFKSARTPAVFSAVLIIFYSLSGIFGWLGMDTFANFSNLIMGIALLSLTLWAYIKYSGAFSDVGVMLDDIASFLWENVMKPNYEVGTQKGLEHAARHAVEHGIGATIGSRASAAAAVSGSAKTS